LTAILILIFRQLGEFVIVNGTERGVRSRQPSRRDWWRLCESKGEEQVIPGRENQVDRNRRQLVEEIVAWPEFIARAAPEFVADVADGVECERQQVQAHQNGCEIVLPVSEAVLKVIALVLQDVESLILDLPPRPATGGKFDDIVGTNRQIGDEAVWRFGLLG